MDEPQPRRRFAPWVRRGLELFALCGFAVAQPVLDVFGNSPDIFIFRNATTADILLFALVVTVVPAAVLLVVELLVSLASRVASRWLHLFLVGGLVALVALQALKKGTSLRGAALVVVAVLVGLGALALYARVEVARLFLRFASPAPVIFALLFLITSPVSQLVFPDGAAAAKLGSAKDAPSVVMITFDEWPTASFLDSQGKIDRALFPNIARLADQSTWYRNATSVTTATWYAVPTILTGKYPKTGDIPDVSSHPNNLFTFLGGSYKRDVFETVTRLCPTSLCPAPPATGTSGIGGLLDDATSTYRKMVAPHVDNSEVTAGFEERESKAAANQKKATAAPSASTEGETGLDQGLQGRPARFEQFLETLRRNEHPTLHYLHILLPHVPYRYLPDGHQYDYPVIDFGRVGPLRDNWDDATWPAKLSQQRMLQQVGYVDRLIGELLDRLESTGLAKRSVLVVTADHGIAFTPGQPARGLTSTPVPESLYPQLLWTPLFVKAAGQTQGSVSDANVMSIDVLPTIAKLTGFRLPWAVDGVPAGTRDPGDRTKVFDKVTSDGATPRVGAPVRFDGDAGFAAMLAGNVDAVTEPGDAVARTWRVKPMGTLVGRKVTGLRIGAPSAMSVTVGQIADLEDFEPREGMVPSLVWGEANRAGTVALAVNGTIAGVSPTFRFLASEHWYSLMVPDSLLHRGGNDVAAYEVTGSADAPVLRPVAIRR